MGALNVPVEFVFSRDGSTLEYLDQEMVDAPSINTFKGRFDKLIS